MFNSFSSFVSFFAFVSFSLLSLLVLSFALDSSSLGLAFLSLLFAVAAYFSASTFPSSAS